MAGLVATLMAGTGLATAAPAPGGGPAVERPPAGAPHAGGAPGARPPGGPPARHHSSSRGYWVGPSFYIGAPYWWWWGQPWAYGPGDHVYEADYLPPAYLPPAYVYGPAGVVTSTGGVVYIEREVATVSTQPPNAATPAAASPALPPPPPGGQWWYLCDSPRGAYPYVRECPSGWERVPAVPRDVVK